MAAPGVLGRRRGTVGFENLGRAFFDAHGVIEVLGAPGPVLSVRSILPNAVSLEKICLVPAEPRICGVSLCDSSAFYVQRKTLLASRAAVWRNPLWPLRQP